MVRERPSARYLAVSVARSAGLLIIALRGRTDNACARRFACSCPVSVSSMPGNCPGSRCSTFHVVCPCRIKNSKRFIFFHRLRRSSLLQQNIFGTEYLLFLHHPCFQNNLRQHAYASLDIARSCAAIGKAQVVLAIGRMHEKPFTGSQQYPFLERHTLDVLSKDSLRQAEPDKKATCRVCPPHISRHVLAQC